MTHIIEDAMSMLIEIDDAHEDIKELADTDEDTEDIHVGGAMAEEDYNTIDEYFAALTDDEYETNKYDELIELRSLGEHIMNLGDALQAEMELTGPNSDTSEELAQRVLDFSNEYADMLRAYNTKYNAGLSVLPTEGVPLTEDNIRELYDNDDDGDDVMSDE